MNPPKKKRVHLAGVPFDPYTRDEALALAADALTRLSPAPPLTVVTPNAVIAGKCLKKTDLSELLDSAQLCLPDGAGTVLASRIASKKSNRSNGSENTVSPFPERVAGIDFAYGVLELAAAGGYPVYLLGGRPGVASDAAKHLTGSLPRLPVTGTHDGYFDSENPKVIAQLLKEIRSSKANILFVCLGFPKQERFLLRYAGVLPDVRIAAGLGGSLDVWAGRSRRAPDFVRRARSEWLYRCLTEPRRIPDLKYAVRFLSECQKTDCNLNSFPKKTARG